MHILEHFAASTPERVAYRMIPSGQEVTWAELELRSRKCAARLLASGLQPGDGIAVFLENHPRYFEILWAAQRAGLYYTTISLHLKPAEMIYIVQDCGARALFCSRSTASGLSDADLDKLPSLRILLDEQRESFVNYDSFVAGAADDATLPDVPEGTDFSYSSGTTGLPKGIRRPLAQANAYFSRPDDPRTAWKQFDRDSVYLSTAPFYHTAPVRWNMAVLRAGGTSLLMEKFDATLALQAIEQYGVTHGQWVPAMFSRLLKLPEEVRTRYDLSSMRYAIHAAAPCPVALKERMIAWWGPILFEYYSGTELVGRTSLNSEEWLAHKGSVGRPEFGAVHIVDEQGAELGPGETGRIYFSGGGRFAYHNDPEKTRSAYDDRGWGTYGDIGHVDADGYLYLTDRQANMIVSGGVNIYPQETENVLAGHPQVRDVAVVGVPDEEFGESVRAVVELHDPSAGSAELARELIAYCRAHISAIKCPKGVDFVEHLPRTDSGKLLKREVKDGYWQGPTRIAH